MAFLFCETCETVSEMVGDVIPAAHIGHVGLAVNCVDRDEAQRLFVEHVRIKRMAHMEREVFTPAQEARLA